MCDLLSLWFEPRNLIPAWIREEIVVRLIVARLNSAVAAWDPLTDTVAIHQWIHPWLNIAGFYYHCCCYYYYCYYHC